MRTHISLKNILLFPSFALLFSGCEIDDAPRGPVERQEAAPPAQEAAPPESANEGNGGNENGNGNANGENNADDIPLDGVVWLDTDISGWAQTSTLKAGVSGATLQLNHTQARQWPTANTRASDGGPLNGNVWILVNVGGTWHAATWDWMRSGQTSKGTASVRGTGGHISRAPLNTFTPRSGETYGFMVSTPARGAERTINERSNVSAVTWP
ncbi:MAG: hypothetical protein JJU29_23275 [Verrucomicrobia bacterium]|nr:hypothetical protein [Verrucomicrobiota bacterium]MCH8514187.1 hypothetical protein [Kiritimatiellia bacterium]